MYGQGYRGNHGGPGQSRGGFSARGDRGGGRGGDRGGGRGGGRGGPVAIEIFSHGAGGSTPQPDLKVMETEKKMEQSSKELSLQSLRLDEKQTMPNRPGYGTLGRNVTLWANYFELVPPKEMRLYRYNIEHGPDSERGKVPVGKKARWIVQLLIEQYFSQLPHRPVTDYGSTLITKHDLGFNQSRAYEVQYRPEGGELRDPPVIHHILLKFTGNLEVSDLINHLMSTDVGAAYISKGETIQALNIITGFDAKTRSSILSIGANKHFPMEVGAGMEKARLGAGLEVFRGFMLSVRAATARILVNVQVKNVACYEAVPLATLMQSYIQDNRLDITQQQTLRKLDKFLKRLRVEVTHIIRKNKAGVQVPRIKTISGLATREDGRNMPRPPVVPAFGAGPNEVKFFIGEQSEAEHSSKGSGKKGAAKGKKSPGKGLDVPQAGEYITVTAFFKREHHKPLQYNKLPVVNVGTRQDPSYLPVDVCLVRRGQPSLSKISPSQTQQMMSFAVRRPVQNAQSITMNGPQVLGLGSQANSTLAKFDMSITPTLITVPGRVLNGPNVRYRNAKVANTRLGSWNMQSIQFTKAQTLPVWSWLQFSAGPDFRSTIQAFQAELRNCGLIGPPPLPGQVVNNPTHLETMFSGIDPTNPRHPKLLLMILPRADVAIYNQIKHCGDIKRGIHTICVVAEKFTRARNEQYFANVALKFNLKLGGVNQSLDPAKLGILGEGKTMVVGLDVTHPSPGSADNAPSIAGIVASVDKALGQWPAAIRVQESRKEMITDLQGMFESRLRLWQDHNQKRLPENILVYRDGVSEGQYNTVLEEELPNFRNACRKLYPATSTANNIPRISIAIVGKRHHTRFYPTREADADRSSNPQNGTVVDRGVTQAQEWDFFLQAHTAIKGTARPAHYYVILDEIFRRRPLQQGTGFRNAADTLQDLTHNMCYLFGRATKAVSICPPAYYADLVCERARCYLSSVFDQTLGASVADSGGEPQAARQEDINVHDRLKDTMFYI